MTRYFAQNTPRAGLEHMMMSVPGFQKRGGGMMILSRFCYKPEDVDCRYCLHYRRRSCQVRTCPYIAERLKSGAIEYLDLILEYFGHIPHAGLHKRIQAVEHWSGPDQAVLHTVSVHLRSRFADRVWDDAPPGYLAALYLLASKERLWQPALPALSHDSIDFSRIVSKPHGFAIQDYKASAAPDIASTTHGWRAFLPRSRKRRSTRSRRTSCRENRSKRSFSAMFLPTTTALGSIRATRWDCRLRSTGSGRRRKRQLDPMPPQFSCVPLRSTSENCAVLPCFSDFGYFPTAHFLTFPHISYDYPPCVSPNYGIIVHCARHIFPV